MSAALEFTKAVALRCWELVKVPFVQTDMLWIITPLVIMMILMALYFGRYKGEELGWNTAFGNSMILIFLSVDLLRHLYGTGELFEISIKSALVAAVIIEGIFLSVFSFFHLFSEQFAFGVGSGVTMNTMALFVIILVYSTIPIDLITILAIAVLSVTLFIILKILEVFQVGVDDDPEVESEDE